MKPGRAIFVENTIRSKILGTPRFNPVLIIARHNCRPRVAVCEFHFCPRFSIGAEFIRRRIDLIIENDRAYYPTSTICISIFYDRIIRLRAA